MTWLLFALGAALSWGVYGVALHTGQVQLGNPLRALLCVGIAYFLIGVLVPTFALSSQGELTVFRAPVPHGPPALARLARSVQCASSGPSVAAAFRST